MKSRDASASNRVATMPRTPATLTVEPGRTLLTSARGRVVDLGAESRSAAVRPFLKWTGGKQWLAAVAAQLLPIEGAHRYVEPFVGGGSVFFALNARNGVLGDLNPELIDAYIGVRDDAERVIATLRSFPYERTFYEAMRRRHPRLPYTKAARMIYLNKTAFNGMYRVNLRGEFNVPFGRFINPTICQSDRIRAASRALQGIDLRVDDFEALIRDTESGDLVYLDPPYITGHTNNGFLKYNAPLFSWDDQKRLARNAVELARRDVAVVVSNSDHHDVTALYKGFFRYCIVRNSLIGGRGSQRGPVQEALLSSVPLCGMPTERI
jgi:DNA adenine methylase